MSRSDSTLSSKSRVICSANVVCHCGSSSVVRLCHPQANALERLPADGKAGLRMNEGECGIRVASVDRLYWVEDGARAKIHREAVGEISLWSAKRHHRFVGEISSAP